MNSVDDFVLYHICCFLNLNSLYHVSQVSRRFKNVVHQVFTDGVCQEPKSLWYFYHLQMIPQYNVYSIANSREIYKIDQIDYRRGLYFHLFRDYHNLFINIETSYKQQNVFLLQKLQTPSFVFRSFWYRHDELQIYIQFRDYFRIHLIDLTKYPFIQIREREQN